MNFLELSKHIAKQKKQINKAVKDVLTIKGVANFIIEEITNRLYTKGTTDKGIKLKTDKSKKDYYSGYTIWQKKKSGKRWQNVTLNDSGDFYQSFKVNVTNNEIEITANFKKGSEEISDNFTIQFKNAKDFEDAVTGMTNEEISELIEKYINDNLSQKIYELL